MLPHISPLFDRIPEAVVQRGLYSFCDPLLVTREVSYDRYLADIVSPRYIIEVKRCSLESKSVGVHQPLGQVVYYTKAHFHLYNESRTPVILIYGLGYDKYLDRLFRAIRGDLGVELWLLVSLKDQMIWDCDREVLFKFSERMGLQYPV